MRIVSLHVVAFGKLKNESVNFSSGLNVLQNVNGFGKTTLASFIRAMLYGFTYTRTKGATDVSHYVPWGSTDKFGGSMVVEHGGETYRIERFFGATARQETLQVTNDKTGKVVDLKTQPGEFLLGLTADSYDRSAYFPQESVELSSNDNFDARLANLVQDGAEDYDKVQDKLRNYRKTFRYERGNGGVIYELDCQKQQLLQQLHNANLAERRSAEIDRRLQEIANEKTALTDRQREYVGELEKLQRQAVQLQPTDEDRRIRARLFELEEKLSRVPAEFDNDFALCDNIAKEISVVHEQPPKPKKLNKSALIVGGVLLVIGIVLVALGLSNAIPMAVGVAIGCCAFAVAIVGLGLVLWEYLGYKRKVSRLTTQTNPAFLNEYLDIARKYVHVDGDDFDDVKRRLWEAHATYKSDMQERNALLPLLRQPQLSVNDVQEQIDGVNRTLLALTQTVNELSAEAGRLSEERKNLVFDSVVIQDKILFTDEQRNIALHRLDVAEYVSKLLEQAKDNLSSNYLPRLCARTSELIREVTQSELAVVIDRNFSVSIRQNGQTKPMGEFSRGIREITLLCFRVALSELMYDGAIPFVIIDDAFVNFDEDNFLRATALIKKLAERAQVIYFTCHHRTGHLV